MRCKQKSAQPAWPYGNKALFPTKNKNISFRSRSWQDTGQLSEDLTYSDQPDITVTDSRGFSPHSASGALPERCNYSFSFIITMRGSIFKSFPPFFRVKNRMMINHIIKAADSRLSAAYVLWVLSCPSGAERRNARNRPLEKLVVQPENDVPAQDERE